MFMCTRTYFLFFCFNQKGQSLYWKRCSGGCKADAQGCSWVPFTWFGAPGHETRSIVKHFTYLPNLCEMVFAWLDAIWWIFFFIFLQNFLLKSTKEDSPLKATDFGLSDFIKPGEGESLFAWPVSFFFLVFHFLFRTYFPVSLVEFQDMLLQFLFENYSSLLLKTKKSCRKEVSWYCW